MKRIFFIFLTLTVVSSLLTSCKKEPIYRNDVSCKLLAAEIYDEADLTEDFSEYNQEELSFLFKGTSLYDDCSVIYSTETVDISEIGVFHCPDSELAQRLYESISEYVTEQQTYQRAFISSYAPYELTKLDDAIARRYGSYVVYMILERSDQYDAWDKIEEMLQK